MASERHKHSLHRSILQRATRLALPTLGVLALVVASLAVAFQHPDKVVATTQTSAHANASGLANTVSRSVMRPPLPEAISPDIKGFKYTTATLDLHTLPDDKSPVLIEIKSGKKVDVTGKIQGGYAQIVHDGAARWVTAKYLSADKPVKGLSGTPCASGSGMESGLQPDTIRVHRAVCAQFPQIVRYGGLGGGGEHATGRAVDIMLGANRASGAAIAAFCMQHARELGISQVIYRQRIWTVQRAGDGWRPMKNRGSATANHMDHVHVTTYGNSGTA